LTQFLVEPFVPHPQDTEYYININSVRDVSYLPFSFLSFSISMVRHGGTRSETRMGWGIRSDSYSTERASC
jgi:hypothetical protein